MWRCRWCLSILAPWLRRIQQNTQIDEANKIHQIESRHPHQHKQLAQGREAHTVWATMFLSTLPGLIQDIILRLPTDGFKIVPPPFSLRIHLTRSDYSLLWWEFPDWYPDWLSPAFSLTVDRDYNLSTWEVESGGLQWVQGPPKLCNKYKAIQGYTATPISKT